MVRTKLPGHQKMRRTKPPGGVLPFRPHARKARDLTPRRQVFVKEYLTDFNATRAAAAAGYKTDGKIGMHNARTCGDMALKDPRVQAVIQAEMDKRAKRLDVSQERIIQELAKIAFADLGDYIIWGPDGVEVVSSQKLLDTACVAEVVQSGEHVKIKLHDKRSALELLGKHLGMFANKVEVSGKIEETVTRRYEVLHRIEEYTDVYSKLADRGRGLLQSGDESHRLGESVDTDYADPEAGGIPPAA